MRPLLQIGILYFLCFPSFAYAGPVVSSIPENHHFGNVMKGSKVSHIFQIKNNGPSPLGISRVKSTCGCSAFFLKDKIIPPGGVIPLKVDFDSTEFIGKIRKTVFIYFSDPQNSKHSISFTANVETLIHVEPDRLDLGTVDLLKKNAFEFPFRVSLDAPNGTITELSYNMDYFEISCDPPKTAENKTVYGCKLLAKKNAPSGSIFENLTLHTDMGRQPFLKLNIHGMLKGAFDIIPALIDFGQLASSEAAVQNLSIINTGRKHFRILKIIPDRPEISFHMKPKPEKFAYGVTVKLVPVSLKDVIKGKIKILTDHPESPEIEIKYQGFVK